MKNKTWKNVIEIKPDGKKGWYGGAYTLAYVYSNKGNFLVKGYLREVEKYLESLKEKGYKYFVNLSLRHTESYEIKTNHRDIWKFYNDDDYSIWQPSRKTNKKKWSKWCLYSHENSKAIMEFKRMPNRWIPEFDNL